MKAHAGIAENLPFPRAILREESFADTTSSGMQSLTQHMLHFCVLKRKRNLLDDSSRPGDLTIRSWARSRGKEKTAFDITEVSPLHQDVRAHAFNNPDLVLQRSREAKFRIYEGKLPPEVGFIPLVVTTLVLGRTTLVQTFVKLCPTKVGTLQ